MPLARLAPLAGSLGMELQITYWHGSIQNALLSGLPQPPLPTAIYRVV